MGKFENHDEPNMTVRKREDSGWPGGIAKYPDRSLIIEALRHIFDKPPEAIRVAQDEKVILLSDGTCTPAIMVVIEQPGGKGEWLTAIWPAEAFAAILKEAEKHLPEPIVGRDVL